MKYVTRRIALDLSRRNNTRIAFASQADYRSREFIISLCDDGMPYYVDKGTTAIVNVKRPDGVGMSYFGEVTGDGCIRYVVGSWALEIPGDAKFSVSLYDGDKRRLTSSHFVISIDEALYIGNGMVEGDETHNAFTEMMSSYASFIEQEVHRQDAECERINNESIRADFEHDRATAEGERVDAEIARDNAELSRIESEAQRVRNEQVRMINEAARLEVTQNLKTALSNLIALQDIYIERGETA